MSGAAKGSAWQRVPAPLRGLDVRDLTLPRLLELQAEHHGERPLLRVGEVRRSYAEMPRAVARVAGSLAAAGIGAGDRVAVMAPHGLAALDLLLACRWPCSVPTI